MSYSQNQLIEIPQAQLMDDAKQSLSGLWGTAVAAYLIVFLISIGGSFIPFLSVIIGAPLALGYAIFSLKISREEGIEVSNIFDGFQNFGKALGTYILMGIGVLLGFLCLIIPGFILAIGLSQTMFILADEPDIKAMDALKKSWAMMDGYKMDYFVLALRFIPWAILCLFTLGIGYLWLMPYYQVTMAKFYDTIRFENDGDLAEDGYDDISKHLVD